MKRKQNLSSEKSIENTLYLTYMLILLGMIQIEVKKGLYMHTRILVTALTLSLLHTNSDFLHAMEMAKKKKLIN